MTGFPCGSAGKESTCNAGDLSSFDPWVGMIPWRRERLPTPEYWSGLPFPSPGDLPDSGIELESRALQADSLLSESPGKLYSGKLYQGNYNREVRFMGFDKCIITWIQHYSSSRIISLP